jgi:hypothetical protein
MPGLPTRLTLALLTKQLLGLRLYLRSPLATRSAKLGTLRQRQLNASSTIRPAETEQAAAPGTATARRQAIPRHRPIQAAASSRARRWALVHVWDGAVLATFDDEAAARQAMNGVDDDEVVVLSVAR